jgi:hypothetical protein
VGTLKDGKTKGFWALLLGTPYRGRVIPCGLITYSSKTIASGLDSRNLNHFRAFAGIKELLGARPLVLDREFSYLELLLNLVAEQVNFVIRLNLGSHPPKFCHADGQEVALTISPGETIIHQRVWYKGQVCVNLIGTWKKGFAEPLWIMTNLEAKEAQRIYWARMKIEIVKSQIDNRWLDRDDVMDHYFSASDDDLLDNELDYTTTLFEGGCLQPFPGHFTEVLDCLNHHLLTESLLLLTTQVLDLPFPRLNLLFCASSTGGQLIQ